MPTNQGAAPRRMTIRRLLASHEITDQQQLARLLVSAGYEVTQATISRDLAALGARKDPANGRYRVEEHRTEDRPETAATIASYVTSLDRSGDLVVLRTPPAAAHLVASAIDGASLPGVMGTVAGDDTVLVVADQTVGGGTVLATLRQLGEQS